VQVRNFEAKLAAAGELVLTWRAPNNNICIKEYVVVVKETGERITVAPKNDRQDGQFRFKAPRGQEGSSFTFTVIPFSNPGGREGGGLRLHRAARRHPLGRRRLLMLQQLLLSMLPGQHQD